MNEQLSSGWTALLHACDTGREEMVELLLERGADPNTHKGEWVGGDSYTGCARTGRLPLHKNNYHYIKRPLRL